MSARARCDGLLLLPKPYTLKPRLSTWRRGAVLSPADLLALPAALVAAP